MGIRETGKIARGPLIRLALLIFLLLIGGSQPVLGDTGDAPSEAGDERSLLLPVDGPLPVPSGADSHSDSPPGDYLAQLSSNPQEPGSAQTTQESADAEMRALGEAMANPLSNLWLLFMQNDTIWHDGDLLDDNNKDAKAQNTFLLNPVLSVQLTENWKTILRPVIPINSFNTVDNINLSLDSPSDIVGFDRERETGLGDIVLWSAFSNQYVPPNIFGFGATIMLPTASDDQLGTGKYSAGPMALAFRITDKWIIGGIAQHWWSFAGEDTFNVSTSAGQISVDRPDVNLTDFQYVLKYRLSPLTAIGIAPNVRYNWETDELNFPIGLGADTLIKIGSLPVKIGFEAYYYVKRDDDFGPEFQLRFFFIPIVPSPEWSKRPLF